MSDRALLLAVALTNRHGVESFEGDAAAELRRLYEENAELWKEREEPHKTIAVLIGECNRLEKEAELLSGALDKLRVMHREEINPLLDVHSQNLELLEALKKIIAIEDLERCGDWEEIEQAREKAREIANAAIAKAEGKE